jgi:putative transposase
LKAADTQLFWDTETGKRCVLPINNFKLFAKSIAGICKTRWRDELFFKLIKQNSKIRLYAGTCKNAVITRLQIALCAYLPQTFHRIQSKLYQSTQLILQLLQLDLFEKRGLMAMLRNDPPGDDQPDVNQMVLLRKLTGQE